MSDLIKQTTAASANDVLSTVYNNVDKSITVDSFICTKVGNKIVRGLPSAAVETYSFYDGSNLLYVLTVTYTDSTLATISQVERTS